MGKRDVNHRLLVLFGHRVRPSQAKLAPRIERVDAYRLVRIDKGLLRALWIAGHSWFDNVIGIAQLSEARKCRRVIRHMMHDSTKELCSSIPFFPIETEQCGLAEQPDIMRLHVDGLMARDLIHPLRRNMNVQRGRNTTHE